MLKLLVIVALLLFFTAKLLPRIGSWLGLRSRKPFRQAKWMWTWFAGDESQVLQAEREYGRECAREFAAQFSGRPSRANQALVETVASRLRSAVKDPRREFAFKVVAGDAANAFALPGGFIFITEPLLHLCGHDRDEVAFFLGHEMAHVLRGHARDQFTTNAFLNAVTGRLGGTGLMLRQALTKGYSRELELEADEQGARLSMAAGFDALAAVRGLRRLAEPSKEESGLLEFFSSHPPIPDRVRTLEQALSLNAKPESR